MKGTKFFGVVIACILTLLLAVEAGFISVAWAKPPGKGRPPAEESQTLPWGVDRIDADEVWGTTKGLGIRVAVLYDGIDIYHPDLEVAGGINTIDRAGPLLEIDPNGDYGAGLVDAQNAVLGTTLAPSRYTLSPRGKLSVTWGKLKSD